MTNEEIHNIWLHMSGKSEGLLEAGGKADFPVLFANAILEFNKRKWVGLTDEERDAMIGATDLSGTYYYDDLYAVILLAEGKLKEKNA